MSFWPSQASLGSALFGRLRLAQTGPDWLRSVDSAPARRQPVFLLPASTPVPAQTQSPGVGSPPNAAPGMQIRLAGRRLAGVGRRPAAQLIQLVRDGWGWPSPAPREGWQTPPHPRQMPAAAAAAAAAAVGRPPRSVVSMSTAAVTPSPVSAASAAVFLVRCSRLAAIQNMLVKTVYVRLSVRLFD